MIKISINPKTTVLKIFFCSIIAIDAWAMGHGQGPCPRSLRSLRPAGRAIREIESMTAHPSFGLFASVALTSEG